MAETPAEETSWTECFKRLFETSEQGVVVPPRVELDLGVSSNEEIERAIDLMKQKLQHRLDARDPVKMKKQLKHVREQVNLNDKNPLSMQHLEVYKEYLGRVTPFDDVAAEHKALGEDIAQLLAKHPQRHDPRSGDKPGTREGGAWLQVPLKRRLQTLVLMILNFISVMLLVWGLIILFTFLFPRIAAVLLIGYYTYAVYSNRTRPMHGAGSGKLDWYTSTEMLKLFRDYFPLRLTLADMDEVHFPKKKSMLFVLHPHGVSCCSGYSLMSNVCGRDVLMPKRPLTAQTLAVNFWIPFVREHMVMLGVGDASAKTIKQALTWTEGASTLLVVGGAKEAMATSPNTSKIALNGRYGFIKIALTTGASLVPVYAFGENSLFENIAANRPYLARLQRSVQKVLTFAPMLVSGRGIFSYSGGVIPNRRTLTTVVGKPIHLEKELEPSKERIQEVHQQYMQGLEELFNTYRDIYEPNTTDMEFV